MKWIWLILAVMFTYDWIWALWGSNPTFEPQVLTFLCLILASLWSLEGSWKK